jgi:hypothetical protein
MILTKPCCICERPMTLRWPYQVKKVRMHKHCRGAHLTQRFAPLDGLLARLEGLSKLECYRLGQQAGYQRRRVTEARRSRPSEIQP